MLRSVGRRRVAHRRNLLRMVFNGERRVEIRKRPLGGWLINRTGVTNTVLRDWRRMGYVADSGAYHVELTCRGAKLAALPITRR